MRLPSLPPDEVGRLVGNLDDRDADMRRIWAASPGGLILAAVHIGNNEAIAAGVASRGLPISVIADDSSFPELFELLRRQRAAWGFTLIPWRNLRAMFGVLRRREMLGLLVDWGYRSDGIPVRLFDAWTTLPAGAATLAAKTGSHILPVWIHRLPDGTFGVFWDAPIVVASSEPAELQRATQEMADAMAGAIRAVPTSGTASSRCGPRATPKGQTSSGARGRCRRAGRIPDPAATCPGTRPDQVGIGRPPRP